MPMQGDTKLLEDPVAVRVLGSTEPARLAYTWLDGSPRVVPIWFHWTGSEVVMASLERAPKIRALRRDPRVAITIDTSEAPHDVLMIRGSAELTTVDDVVPEYAMAARRYMGEEQGNAWVSQIPTGAAMYRIAVRPQWVGILDFRTRFPSALG